MRTNIDIDDALMAQALQAGPYQTKKDAVEAGLKLLARQAAYREVSKWRGKLKWEGDEAVDWVAANRSEAVLTVQEPRPAYAPGVKPTAPVRAAAPSTAPQKARRAGR